MTKNSARKPALVWMKNQWGFKYNPFPQSGIARLGGDDKRENGLLFRPEVQEEKINEAIEKFILGGAFSGLKFGYLWSLGSGLGGDQRGFGKSSMLQYLVQETNKDFGRTFFMKSELEEADFIDHNLCATLASFDMANARSLAAVFFEATRYACRFQVGEEPTLAARLRNRLIKKLQTDDEGQLKEKVFEIWDRTKGRTIGPPVEELVDKLCNGDQAKLGRFIEGVKTGSRGRVSAANYLATFLYFVKAAGIPHMLLGCDQLEDFAATSTTRQKRTIEVERFRDYVLELQPMADMLTVIVTLHPRAQQAISQMWRLADLPDSAPERRENQSRVVVLEAIEDIERAKDLLKPYLDDARTARPTRGQDLAPFSPDAIEVLLSRSDGKPREILKKAHVLFEQGSAANCERITGTQASRILDSLRVTGELEGEIPVQPGLPIEEIWTN